MIQCLKLIYYQFEPIRESQSNNYRYELTNGLMRFSVKREGRINYQEQGEFQLASGAQQTLYDFLATHDLLGNRSIKHDPYNHPSAYKGADGLDIRIEYQIGEHTHSQRYRGTAVQLESYVEPLHELWRLVHHFIPQNQTA